MNWVIPMAIFRFVLQKDVYLVKLMWLCFSGSNWLLTLLLTYKTWDSGDQIRLKRMGAKRVDGRYLLPQWYFLVLYNQDI